MDPQSSLRWQRRARPNPRREQRSEHRGGAQTSGATKASQTINYAVSDPKDQGPPRSPAPRPDWTSSLLSTRQSHGCDATFASPRPAPLTPQSAFLGPLWPCPPRLCFPSCWSPFPFSLCQERSAGRSRRRRFPAPVPPESVPRSCDAQAHPAHPLTASTCDWLQPASVTQHPPPSPRWTPERHPGGHAPSPLRPVIG